ncbi:MAG: AbrB/MazE/SpoVT family DNA-binding domain-containing protein [Beijerinckiaceae bacterium]
MNKQAQAPQEKDFTTLKVVQIGNSLGVVLPRDVLDELNVEKGDKLFITRSPEGYRFTRNDPEFERRMALAREIMRRRHNVLNELAK